MLVEFALGGTVLWLLFSGVFQFGYAFYIYNILQTSVGNAAQLASRMPYDNSNVSNFVTQVSKMAAYGDLNGTKPVAPGLSWSGCTQSENVWTCGNVKVTIGMAAGSDGTTQIPTAVTVAIASFAVNAVFRTFNFSGKPRATVAYLGLPTGY
jgi:Flp pilus assembly protein TadG